MQYKISENILQELEEKIKKEYNTKSTKIIAEKRKSYSLKINPKLEVKIKVPDSVSEKELMFFLYRKRNWLQKQIEYFEKLYELECLDKGLMDNYIYYLGEKLNLKIITIRQKKEFIEIIGNDCIIHTNNNDKEHIDKILKKYLKNKAKLEILELMQKQWQKFKKYNDYKGNEPNYKIKCLKRCWGNCRPSLITLNYNLIFVPLECIEYVLMHELCHLVHPNHSKAFYELLEYNLANWKYYREILKTFGYRLKIMDYSL